MKHSYHNFRLLTIYIFFLILFLTTYGLFAQEDKNSPTIPHFFQQLSEEQQQSIHNTIEKMRSEGASRQEIGNAVRVMLQEYGVEASERIPRGRSRDKFFDNLEEKLTQEQRAEIRILLKEMFLEGASYQEIQQIINQKIQSYGVEMEEEFQGRPPFPPFVQARWKKNDNLTKEQHKEINQNLFELWKEGTDPKEIHEFLKEKLTSLGIETPDKKDFRNFPGRRFGFEKELTEEQRTEIREKIKSLHESGKSREEIRTEMSKLLKEYGIEPPEREFDYPKDQNKRREKGADKGRIKRPPFEQLTKEQRIIVHNQMLKMWEEGKTGREIHTKMKEMIDSFNIHMEQEQNSKSEESGAEGIESYNFPNPFNPSTTISYTIDNPNEVLIQIFNSNGQHIRTLLNEYQSAGTHSVFWDGRDKDGNILPSGIYFYRIKAGNQEFSKKMILTK
jgi:hypothetical protein